MSRHGHSFDRSKFHLVTMVSNPVRYQSRYRLYRKFAKQMEHAGINFWTVEVQTGHRPFAVTDKCNPRHIQLRHHSILWQKEVALNIGIARLPDDWETVCIADADIEFVQKNWGDDCVHDHTFHEHHDWVTEILHQLQIHKIVQCFETAIDLGPHGQAFAVHKSFMSEYIKNGARFHERKKEGGRYHSESHPGFCYAFRREAIDGIGGLLDRSILGAGDRALALCLVGKGELSVHPDSHGAYIDYIMQYQEHCEKSIRRDVGYVKGTILHHFHGAKADRKYWDRWRILVDNDFRPYHDIKPNSYGLYELNDDGSDRFVRLRDQIRAYMAQRDEDGNRI